MIEVKECGLIKMVELTNREKRIVHTMNVMNNIIFAEIPFKLKKHKLKDTLRLCGYNWNEAEMAELVKEIINEIIHYNESTLKLLDKHTLYLRFK